LGLEDGIRPLFTSQEQEPSTARNGCWGKSAAGQIWARVRTSPDLAWAGQASADIETHTTTGN